MLELTMIKEHNLDFRKFKIKVTRAGMDVNGRVCGAGGRYKEDDKYLNNLKIRLQEMQ